MALGLDPVLVAPVHDHRNAERALLALRLRDIHPPDWHGPPEGDTAVHPHRQRHPGRRGQRDLSIDARRPAAGVALRHLPHADQRVRP
jgi:hypothetical protein